jgi:hypothetical protein
MTISEPMSRAALRLPAILLIAGQLLYVGVTQLHAGGDANDHHHIFEHYAENGIWGLVHIGQFLAVGLLIAGLLALRHAMAGHARRTNELVRLGAGAGLVALALYGALQAVDGVALKQAVMAWANAPDSEQAARFVSAESIRWLEWGMRSYHDFALGLALLLFGAAIASSAAVPRAIGWLMSLSGFAYLAQGWVAGAEGFTAAQSIGIVAAWALCICWMTWLAIHAWGESEVGTRKGSANPATA